MNIISNYSLYLVLSSEYAKNEDILKIAKLAIEGGIDMIQLREKLNSPNRLIKIAKELSRLCKSTDKIFIVNDDPELARIVNADGVHLGQEDIKKTSIQKVKKILGKNKLIGLSTHSIKEIKEAKQYNPDYISFGPIFPTEVKNYSIGTNDIKKVINLSSWPVFFIGGINICNISEILSLGAKNIAMIRQIIQSENITKKIKQIKKIMSGYNP